MNWRKKLKALRAEHDYTQPFVAEYLGIDYSTYGKIENGKTGMDVEKAIRLAELYKISVDEVLGRQASNAHFNELSHTVREPKPYKVLVQVETGDHDEVPRYVKKLEEAFIKFNKEQQMSKPNSLDE